MTRQDLYNKVLNNRFFTKNGEFSKTSAILVATWVFVLFKYLFATSVFDFMIPYIKIQIHWNIVFNWPDAAAITGAASSLYFAVHKKTSDGNKEEKKEMEKKEG